jgi:MFS family permease
VSAARGAAGQASDRRIIALLGAMFASATGYGAIGTVLGIQVYELSRRELDLGLLGLAQFTPALILVLLTGYVSDRFDRARICSASAAGQAVIGLALAAYAGTNPTDVGPIFAIVVGLGSVRAFLSAAQGPLPADLVEPARLPWLSARRALASRPGLIVGPVLGGALSEIDHGLPYLAIAAVFTVAALLFWSIRGSGRRSGLSSDARPGLPPPPSLGPWREALEGLRVIRTTPLLLGAISLDLFAVLFGGAIALLPAIAEDRLGTDAVGLGWLRAAAGIGSVIVLIGLARRPVERHVGRTLLLAVGVFGVATIGLGVTTEFVVAFVAMAVLSGADSISVFIRSTLVPLASPVAKRGRVAAFQSLFIGASNELGAFESGVTGELLGSSNAVIVGGVATVAIVIGYGIAYPALTALDRYPQVAVAADGGPP